MIGATFVDPRVKAAIDFRFCLSHTSDFAKRHKGHPHRGRGNNITGLFASPDIYQASIFIGKLALPRVATVFGGNSYCQLFEEIAAPFIVRHIRRPAFIVTQSCN